MGSQRGARRTQAAGRGVGPGTLAQIKAAQKTPAGVSISYVPPSAEAVRAAIAEGKCPFCGSGPWKMLPVHTNKAHGVDKWELREMAQLSTNDPLCSNESREKMREAALRNPGAVERATEAARRARPNRRTTAAGRERNTATITAWMQDNPEQAREAQLRAAASVTPEGRARQREAAIRWGREHRRSDDYRRAFAERMHSPEVAAKRAAARPLQPCGTVASYKRGCRCEACSGAKRASRGK